jgi:hypothetical protein
MRLYVASSWRNDYQEGVVTALREDGHEVYDFKNPAPGNNGFGWKEIAPDWQQWSPEEYLEYLSHPLAEKGFKSDMDALMACECCIMVMPCGPSASMEMGWAAGAGKKVLIYVPAMREPDLMIKMADFYSTNLFAIREKVQEYEREKRAA